MTKAEKFELERIISNLQSHIDGYIFNNMLDEFRDNIDRIIKEHKEQILKIGDK